jgi:ketosteroid isomerase-like protein
MKRTGVELEEDVAFLTTFRAGKAVRIEMFRTAAEAVDAAKTGSYE